MPMREECKHFQSRTYSSGEVARFCELDLAPEAPWRCPENCPSTSAGSPTSDGFTGRSSSPRSRRSLPAIRRRSPRSSTQAEDIVNAVAPEAWEEAERKQAEEERRRDRGRRWPWKP